jgi:Rps23 Pro-64 3,4-dihydroxylase Tpa1-like proline 4-hydroxylase
MNLEKNKVFYEPWSFAIIEDCLNKKEISQVKKEIVNCTNYDDRVMVNRKRIHKGSKNFQYLTKKSKAVKKIYNHMNTEKFYKKVRNLFDLSKLNWIPDSKYSSFSKNFYGEQEFSIKEKVIKKLSSLKLIKTSMSLDMDFSVSEKGYFRIPHRERDTKVMTFLIYLNTMKKAHGGALEIYKSKKNENFQNKYSRFPKKTEIKFLTKMPPKAGRMVIFFSSPDSYHAAEIIKKSNLKRVFIYGAFALNKKVSWSRNKIKQSRPTGLDEREAQNP